MFQKKKFKKKKKIEREVESLPWRQEERHRDGDGASSSLIACLHCFLSWIAFCLNVSAKRTKMHFTYFLYANRISYIAYSVMPIHAYVYAYVYYVHIHTYYMQTWAIHVE